MASADDPARMAFPDLRFGGGSSTVVVRRDVPLMKRPVGVRYMNQGFRKPITRSSSEPVFRNEMAGLRESVMTELSPMRDFVSRVRQAKSKRDAKRTILRPYAMDEIRSKASSTLPLPPRPKPSFRPCNPHQARLHCTEGRTGRVGSSTPFEAVDVARREAELDSKARRVGGNFGTSSTASSKASCQANYWMFSPDAATRELERSATQERIQRNVATFAAKPKPKLNRETVQWLIQRKLKSHAFGSLMQQEFEKMRRGDSGQDVGDVVQLLLQKNKTGR